VNQRRSRGQAIVELALILPVLLVLLAAGADLARLFHSQVAIESAARAGALEAASNPTSFVAGQPCSTATNRVMCAVLTESAGSFLTVAPADVTLTCTPTPCAEALGNTVEVRVVGHFSLMTPILAVFTGGTNVVFSQSAVAQISVRPTVADAGPDRNADAHTRADPDAHPGPVRIRRADPDPDRGADTDPDAVLHPADRRLHLHPVERQEEEDRLRLHRPLDDDRPLPADMVVELR
jgi:Flp pilus assembly protein TadG